MCPIPADLLGAVKGTYTGFEARLREVPYSWQEDQLKVSGNFFYLTFRDGEPTLDEFVDYIYWRIIPFCIPRRERKALLDRFTATGDERYLHELTDKARNLFIRARQKRLDAATAKGQHTEFASGEPGELILFLLLEGARQAPQIACKMYLKTSEDMPVHGSDGIHISQGSSSDSLRIIWGESKLYQELASALDDICSSIASFIATDGTRSARERDIDILRDHMDIEDPAWREALLRYFDPYEHDSLNREEAFACFVGFDYATYGTLDSIEATEREKVFLEKYQARIQTACALFGEKLRATSLSSLRIDFFLIPFPSVAALRRRFLNKLGVQS